MADFNIRVKADGVGKSAAMSTRQRAVQASQKSALKPGAGQVGQNRDLISSIKGLNTSIQKLIASNRTLEASIKSNRGGGSSGGGSGGGGGRVPGFGGAAGFGGMGASIPIAGAAIAGIGFAIQKINQIGNAYIELTSQQSGSVGVAGMQRGRRGMYLQTEQGAMEKAHRMSAGRYGGAGNLVSDRAMQIGSIFGMGAGEIGQISGQFARGGGNLTRAANVAAGSGIETEMPLFLQSMSSILQEAVTQGVNSSNLADDLGDQIVMLTRSSGTNSVGMATNIVKNLRGAQQQVSRGQIGGYQQFLAYKASGGAINQRLSDPARREEYLGDLINRGLVSLDEVNNARARASSQGRSINLSDLESVSHTIGPVLRREYAERGGADVNEGIMSAHKRILGSNAEGLRRMIGMNVTGMGIREQETAWSGIGQRPTAESEAKGGAEITSRFKATEGTAPFSGLARQAQRQDLLMTHGAAFADISLKMEKSMITVVGAIAPVAEKALPMLGAAVVTLSNQLTKLTGKLKKEGIAGTLKDAFTHEVMW